MEDAVLECTMNLYSHCRYCFSYRSFRRRRCQPEKVLTQDVSGFIGAVTAPDENHWSCPSGMSNNWNIVFYDEDGLVCGGETWPVQVSALLPLSTHDGK